MHTGWHDAQSGRGPLNRLGRAAAIFPLLHFLPSTRIVSAFNWRRCFPQGFPGGPVEFRPSVVSFAVLSGLDPATRILRQRQS